ncbi:MAG: 23S rRNA (uracil(1939)-C(5))-methyltransferase RlmD [Haliangiales bacterium]
MTRAAKSTPERALDVGQVHLVRAQSLDAAGFGLAPLGAITLAVFDLLPGEQARVAIEHLSPHRRMAWGSIVSRVGPTADIRTAPACPRFGRCGGCTWQHLRADMQLEYKRQAVVDALAGAGLDTEVAAARASAHQHGYRNKASYVIGRGPDGLSLGAYAPRSHAFVSTLGCRTVEPVLDRAAAQLRPVLADSGIAIYDERARTGVLRYLILRSGADGRVLVGLVTTSAADPATIDALARDIAAQASIPTADDEAPVRIAGVVWIRNDSRSGALFDRALPDRGVRPVLGSPHCTESVVGPSPVVSAADHVVESAAESAVKIGVEIGIGDFFQVHRAQARAMYAYVVAEAARLGPAQGARRRAGVVDLYTGVGGLAFGLAQLGRPVLGVEVIASAVRAAERAAARAGLDERVTFRVGDAAELAAIVAAWGHEPTVIAVNPPRRGLSQRARAALSQLAPEVLLYVSCSPTSLARDLAALVASGFAIDRVQPFDLMPGTPQIETVVSLHRDRAGAS